MLRDAVLGALGERHPRERRADASTAKTTQLRDQNRRDICKSQSRWTDPKMDSCAGAHLLEGVPTPPLNPPSSRLRRGSDRPSSSALAPPSSVPSYVELRRPISETGATNTSCIAGDATVSAAQHTTVNK
jgi:hypothetical protein